MKRRSRESKGPSRRKSPGAAPPQSKKHILLCVAGRTPQIVTETLYVLTQEQHKRVDEIRVITTSSGKDRLMQVLLDRKQGKFFQFCREYGIDALNIAFDESTIALLETPDRRVLPDIRTLQDNEHAGDQICNIVRQLAKDADSRIYASVAGGRKTMGIYLTAAMQLFGRAEDTLTHVLVSEDFEEHPDFYYIPAVPRMLKMWDGRKISTRTARIDLANIPFIRLRGIMSDKLSAELSYNELVQRTQADLGLLETIDDLVIDLKSRTIRVSNCRVKLPEREFFVYTMFANFRRQGRKDNGFVLIDKKRHEIKIEDVNSTFRQILSARGEKYPNEGWEDGSFQFIPTLRKLVSSTSTGGTDLLQTVRQVRSRIKRKSTEFGRMDRYLILNRGERGDPHYGLDVAPERIIFE